MKSIYFLLSLVPLAFTTPMNSCNCQQVDCTAKSTPAVRHILSALQDCLLKKEYKNTNIPHQDCFCLNYCCSAEIGSQACSATAGPAPATMNTNTTQTASTTETYATNTGTHTSSSMASTTRTHNLTMTTAYNTAASNTITPASLRESASKTSPISNPVLNTSVPSLPIPNLSTLLAGLQGHHSASASGRKSSTPGRSPTTSTRQSATATMI